jgi:hypothetical protein
MDKTRFRSLMHEAIGDQPMQPWLPAAVRTRLTEPRPRGVPGGLALLAAALLTVLVVAALVGPRWLSHLAPSATSGPVPNCLLPVYVGSEVGFVDTHTGRYTKDVSASVVGLPDSFASRPSYYSPVLKRWLPASVSYMSPDGRSYAWIRFLPDGSTQANFKTAELHRYEVATRTDQALWSTTVFFIVWRWDAAGILVSEPPDLNGPASGTNRAPANWWLVDPVTGAATQQVSLSHASLYSFTPLAGDPTDISFSSVGFDAEGHPIWWLFTNGKGGGVNWVFYETAPGQRVFIYRGPKDDASALDPLAAMADSTGIWFSDYRDPNVIRHWQQGTGLRNVMVTGLPAMDQSTFPGAIPSSPCF